MPIADKATLRRRLVAARQAVTAPVRAREAEALIRHLGMLVTGGTVCAYVPVGAEPGSIAMLDTLVHRGVRVLLPVAGDADQPLRWGPYRPGELVSARFGLLEPGPPALPASAVADADVVLVPALAVDRRGARLGRGGGYYDRSLRLADTAARLVAVVRDDELVDELPTEPHDVPMTHALTPGGGVSALGADMRE